MTDETNVQEAENAFDATRKPHPPQGMFNDDYGMSEAPPKHQAFLRRTDEGLRQWIDAKRDEVNAELMVKGRVEPRIYLWNREDDQHHTMLLDEYRNILIKNGMLSPDWEAEARQNNVSLDVMDSRIRELFAKTARSWGMAFGATVSLFVAEVWTLDEPTEMAEAMRTHFIHDNAKRREAVAFFLETNGQFMAQLILPIRRFEGHPPQLHYPIGIFRNGFVALAGGSDKDDADWRVEGRFVWMLYDNRHMGDQREWRKLVTSTVQLWKERSAQRWREEKGLVPMKPMAASPSRKKKK